MSIPQLPVRWRESTCMNGDTPLWGESAWPIKVSAWDVDPSPPNERFRYGVLVGVMGGQAVVVETKTGAVHLFGSGYLQRIPKDSSTQ